MAKWIVSRRLFGLQSFLIEANTSSEAIKIARKTEPESDKCYIEFHASSDYKVRKYKCDDKKQMIKEICIKKLLQGEQK